MTTTAPGPYEAKVPRDDRPKGGYRTAEQELSDALEGTAPALSRTVASLIGPARTIELARAVKRATNLAVRRHAFEHVAEALAIVEAGVDGIPPECEAIEEKCDHVESLHGRCTACGMTWEQQAEVRRG